MKPALQLRLHQQLALTPQLQQAIRLLQLSSVELEMELRQALESNPLLELSEPGEESANGEGDVEGATTAEAEATPAEAEAPASENNNDELNGDLGMEFELGRTDYGNPSSDDDDYEAQDQEPEDLRDHLLWQLNLSPLSPRANS